MCALSIHDKIDEARAERTELEQRLSDPAIIAGPTYRDLTQRYAQLRDLITLGEEWEALLGSIAEEQEMLETEDDLREELEKAIAEDQERAAAVEAKIKRMLVPVDPNDRKTAILEIRAGTGGDESALFAADLFRMYVRFAEHRGLKPIMMDSHPTPLGGFKQLTFAVEGDGAYGLLRYESGVHRVQRVPETESQGRVHTSTASVVVLPEAEDVEIEIDPNDLRIDVFRSSGPGGQSVNTTDSAVRITHTPSGIVVTCQDEKSQHKNKASALRVLRARLQDQHECEKQAELSATRKSHIGSGDRSEKIRTYNFSQNRITDHRIGFSLYNLSGVLEGNLDPLLDALGSAAAELSEEG